MTMRSFGTGFELGEPQWGVMLGGDGLAHWWRLTRRDDPDWAATPCGSEVHKPLLYHPGSMPLCRHCAIRHQAPGLHVSDAIIDWMSRPTSPDWTDRIRIPPRR